MITKTIFENIVENRGFVTFHWKILAELHLMKLFTKINFEKVLKEILFQL